MSSLFKALFTGTSKHKKLSEEWATLREPVVEGVTFHCKYLGSTLVDDPKGEAATAEAIKRVIHSAKLVARKPERVALHVSLKGIRMEDTMTRELLLQTSIYKALLEAAEGCRTQREAAGSSVREQESAEDEE
ncbi:Low density lipoprotein receptor adapter protein 1 [Chionoecetes opilio]|uniref:Low density lipoprotein receptor adapter protein 1 n=1 Tax=Chionoecetes opilio TaxID=41210 RepID=A0A8J5CMI3_CHIOP|nr:Low density lipoprotein receptor adapter protein 1 [Chionoecetes opilio]